MSEILESSIEMMGLPAVLRFVAHEDFGKETMIDLMGRAANKIDSLEAKIDALMFEHCPKEMTERQKERWAEHQEVSDTIPTKLTK